VTAGSWSVIRSWHRSTPSRTACTSPGVARARRTSPRRSPRRAPPRARHWRSSTEEDCSGCKTCIPLCPYQAILHDDAENRAEINEVLCKGCGVCVAACPSGSIVQNLFEDMEIYEEIEGVLAYA
jgi:Pyruvate/2-oxoacid:ferredoxin oxidoreductase delta subunit